MCQPLLSSDLALRVARAAQSIGVEPRAFIPVLIESVGLPFTDAKLTKITVRSLSDGLAASDNPAAKYAAGEDRSLKESVRYLWGFTDEDATNLPATPHATEPKSDGAVRVAVATSTGERVDGHFGATLRFFVYDVSTDAVELIDHRSTEGSVDAEEPTDFRVALVRDCQVLYVQSIGGPPAGKVIQHGIHPLKIADQPLVAEVLAELQARMAASPPPWLAKAMGVPVEDRIRFTEAVEL